MYVKWSQDQYIRDNVSKIERKEKIQKSSLHPSKNTPPISYINPPPMSITTFISKLLPLFVMRDKGVSTSNRHLIITRRASIIILINIIIAGAIDTLILRSRWRWRGSRSEITHDSLSLCDTTNTGVHLTQLITKSVKASIHANKLCRDGLKCHSTH